MKQSTAKQVQMNRRTLCCNIIYKSTMFTRFRWHYSKKIPLTKPYLHDSWQGASIHIFFEVSSLKKLCPKRSHFSIKGTGGTIEAFKKRWMIVINCKIWLLKIYSRLIKKQYIVVKTYMLSSDIFPQSHLNYRHRSWI